MRDSRNDTMMLYRSSFKTRCEALVARFDAIKAKESTLSDTQKTILSSQPTIRTVRMMKGLILGAAIGGHDAMCVSLEFLGDIQSLETMLDTHFS